MSTGASSKATGANSALGALAAEEAECRRCELYRHATQVVPGQGPAHARVMLVDQRSASAAGGWPSRTDHHSSLLSLGIRDEADKTAEYARFVTDLRTCAEALRRDER